LLTVVVLGLNVVCATVDRAEDRTTVVGGLEYGRARHRQTGCGGYTIIQSDQQVGGRVGVRHLEAAGVRAEGELGVIAGFVDESIEPGGYIVEQSAAGTYRGRGITAPP